MIDGLIPCANLLKDMKVTLYALGVGSGSDYSELQSLAAYPVYGHFFKLKDYEQLNHVADSFAHLFCASKCNSLYTCFLNIANF